MFPIYEYGTDGEVYRIEPLHWTVDKVREVWDRTKDKGIFNDEMAESPENFLSYVLQSGAVWFELMQGDQSIGLMYLTNLEAGTRNDVVQAYWHALVWEPKKASICVPVFRKAIMELFDSLRLQKLYAEVPIRFRATIKVATKIGFVQEGRLRECRNHRGIWFDAVLLGLLKHEVAQWER